MGYSMKMIRPTAEMVKSDESYYGVQIWAMEFYRDMMRPILDWEVEVEPVESPKLPEAYYNWSWEKRLSHSKDVIRRHSQRAMEALSKRSTDPGLVIGCKFGDPGGIVVPDECRVIVRYMEGLDLTVYKARTEVDSAYERVTEWLDYCRRAINYGGFEVI